MYRVNIQNLFIHNLFSAIILRNFLETIMLNYLDRYMTQTRMESGKDKFASKGPIRGQKGFLMTKSRRFCNVFYFQTIFPETQTLISLECLF